jgi:glucosamine 6-phosphate synthetase-like amidotransferase/phosphosugar isomerase protein
LDILSVKLKNILDNTKNIKELSKKYSKYKNMFFLGRNLLFPIALE